MKNALAGIALALLTVSTPQAAIIFQTQNYSNVSTTPAILTWNKFDLNLGTLTAITLEATGILSGSYDIHNTDTEEVATLGSNSTGRIRLTLLGPGAPSVINGLSINPLVTSPVSTAGQTINPGVDQTFTLLSGPGVNQSSISSNQFANAAYFSALGGGTFNSSMARQVILTVTSGGTFDTHPELVLAGGTINITYEYTPVGAIPEPGTWAAAALLAGGAAFMRWRKRKVAAN